MTAHLGYQIPSPAILEKLGTAFHWAVDRFRFAMFYTKVHDRLLRPLLAADQPPAPVPIRKALHTIDIHITETIDQARLLPKVA